jgi:hypothetical protein
VAEAALETAKEQQRLAQERVNIIEAQIKLQTEQNNLLKEQEGILDKLKEALVMVLATLALRMRQPEWLRV